jgi:pimeloyl-ACP methyl ester carboxylesterase
VSTRRRILAGLFGALAAPTIVRAQSAAPGVVLLHGKQGTPMFPGLRAVASKLEASGFRTAAPEMPWSRSRYLEGNAEKAFDEIASALGAFKRAGAAKLFLVGHSIGATAALGYAVTRGGIDGLAMLSTGHTPTAYFAGVGPANAAVRESILRARETRNSPALQEFADNNQGKALALRLSAIDFLSYFDPGGAMDASAQIAQAPCPVLWSVGTRDIIYAPSRAVYFDRLPSDPRHVFFEADADHLSLPALAADRVASFFGGLKA